MCFLSGGVKNMEENVNVLFVVFLGMATVFVGLICIIVICKILGVCCQLLSKRESGEDTVAPSPVAPAVAPVPAVIPNRRETVAAIAAAIAEDLGTDVSAIRILSIEQL